jgi:ribonucleoside-diphosphate reductase alpha chain
MPQWLKDRGLKINQSNLCSEIILPTNKDRTAVCCLSSVNLEYYDLWSKNKQFINDIAEMLDNVLTFFIEHAPDAVSRATYSATRERSIGLGALGFHAYLQKKNIPFESIAAKAANVRMFRYIRKQMEIANERLGKERGEAPDAEGTGKRFSHLMAIAPNASSSIIMGNTSPSIEPWRANAYRQDTLSGAYLNKNKYLDALIKKKCDVEKARAQEEGSGLKFEYDKIWREIIASEGSVQTLKNPLTDEEKEMYKTSMEIDQRWVIEHAADRQKFIDQAQSVNVFFRPDANIKYLHAVHFLAWKSGLKTLYYCRSEKIGKADKISKQIERQIIKEIDLQEIAQGEPCLVCEG